MSSPWKSFLIKDILSNKYEVIQSTTNHNTIEFLPAKPSNDRYYFNQIHFPIYPLPLIYDKSNISKSPSWWGHRYLSCSISILINDFYLDTIDPGRVSREFRPRKKRKIRAAFTTYQICALENWFSRQKYLTTSDRDQIANELQLSAAQVVTVSLLFYASNHFDYFIFQWFQNRRAKLKRHYEQLKANINDAERKQKMEKLIDFL